MSPPTSLPAFTGVGSVCRKCGARAATTTYRPENAHSGAVVRAEHLERGCTRCGYRWPEATVDTVPSAEGNAATPASVRTVKETTYSNQTTPGSDRGPS